VDHPESTALGLASLRGSKALGGVLRDIYFQDITLRSSFANREKPRKAAKP
jgi:hypothetical protein